ncbi:uncharacterized protein LOC122663675 [Telopea speciosissima]|uniref:uncharacterized protein LOC122663675 n=1 Tax=Telopea speciosissima TaxID=54955 RepID=UPI001CC4714A|nr:uncharacterized protein LOC122663675 [Telopea speciosissima]
MEYNTLTLTETNSNKRVRYDSEDSEFDSPEAKRIRENLLDILDDADLVVDRNQTNQDLASVMKSFEEEISNSTSLLQPESVTLTPTSLSDSGGSQPDLGYLLEASDDELGLPPNFSSSSGEEEKNEGDCDGEGNDDLLHVASETVGMDQIWGFDDEIQGYESMGFGIGGGEEENNGGFVALEGLFDYSDVISGNGSDFSDLSWRPESLPAL